MLVKLVADICQWGLVQNLLQFCLGKHKNAFNRLKLQRFCKTFQRFWFQNFVKNDFKSCSNFLSFSQSQVLTWQSQENSIDSWIHWAIDCAVNHWRLRRESIFNLKTKIARLFYKRQREMENASHNINFLLLFSNWKKFPPLHVVFNAEIHAKKSSHSECSPTKSFLN